MSRNSFQPPKWCCVPEDWEKHAQALVWLDNHDGKSSRGEASIGSQAVYTIGRDNSDLKLQGEMASRLHAAILLDAEGRKFLVDMKSTHGTFLGSQRLSPNTPVRWQPGERASFGAGPTAEVAELREASGFDASSRKRKSETDEVGSGDEGPPVTKTKSASSADDLLASLYGDLPDASNVEPVAPRSQAIRQEPLPPVPDPTKIIFLDIDGCLRPVHGRRGFEANVRTMLVEGVRVPLLGSGEAKAGLVGMDFWPSALRCLRHIVQKTQARIVLSSDWRKSEELVEGINGQLEEHRMPELFGQTPDLDPKDAVGVVKALHGSFREKRCKEIRRWLRAHPKIERFVAIDDIDLSVCGKGDDPSFCLDSSVEFVRCAPMTGLTMELAKIAVCFLNDVPVTQEMMEAAYNNQSGAQGGPEPFQINMGGNMGGPEATPGLMPGLA